MIVCLLNGVCLGVGGVGDYWVSGVCGMDDWE